MKAYTARLTLRLALGVSLVACLCLVAGRVVGAQFNRSPILVYSAFEYSQKALQYPIVLVDVERSIFSRLPLRDTDGGIYPACSVDLQVAFTSQAGMTHNHADIYVMHASGAGMVQATSNLGANTYPRWSPDGRWLAFVSSMGALGGEIYVTDFGERPPQRITDGDEIYEHPVWSPDGTRMLFTAYRETPSHIYMVSLADNTRRRVTENPAYEWSPAWSPDGRSIAFASNRDGKFDIYLIDSDGSNLRRLAHTARDDDFPVWSPDGSRIAFFSAPSFLYVVDADGGNLRLLSDQLTSNQAPVWSPDGRYLALVSEQRGYADIFLIQADGSASTRLVRTQPIYVSAAWCP